MTIHRITGTMTRVEINQKRIHRYVYILRILRHRFTLSLVLSTRPVIDKHTMTTTTTTYCRAHKRNNPRCRFERHCDRTTRGHKRDDQKRPPWRRFRGNRIRNDILTMPTVKESLRRASSPCVRAYVCACREIGIPFDAAYRYRAGRLC